MRDNGRTRNWKKVAYRDPLVECFISFPCKFALQDDTMSDGQVNTSYEVLSYYLLSFKIINTLKKFILLLT